MTKLSIIIPVFNAAKFLHQTLDSVLNQSLKDIELICVDDGSTDESVEILNSYAQKDSRVTVLQQENLHAGVARNTGLAAAAGEYVHFLDADDYVFDYAYEALYCKAAKHNLDYLSAAAIPYDVQKEKFLWSEYYTYERIDPKEFNKLIDASPKSPIYKVSVAPWSGIYRREFLVEKDLQFNNLFCVNDKSFFYSVITNAERMMISRDYLVAHRINMSDSLVGVRAQHFECHFQSFKIILDRMIEDDVSEKIKTSVINREFKDTLNWFEKYRNDPDYGEQIARETEKFVTEDNSPYKQTINKLYHNKLAEMAERVSGESPKTDDEVLPFPVQLYENPKVSVIIPVYNSEDYLNEAIHSLLIQTVKEAEFICVDDGSTDSSPVILKELEQTDHRIRIFTKENAGAGAARNYGLKYASGEYIYFFDSDDLCAPNLFELAIEQAEKTNADIVAFNFSRFYPDGRSESRKGIHLNQLYENKEVFNYSDCPDRIMNIINPTPWNKLYRSSFIREADLLFEEITSSNDITFAAVSSAKAERISYVSKELIYYRVGHSGTITSGKEYKLGNILQAVSSAFRQVSRLPYYNEILQAVRYFLITQYVFGLKNNVKDITLPVSQMYYEKIHEIFREPMFAGIKRADVCKNSKYDNEVFNNFIIIQKNDYDEYCMRKSQQLIVSLTTFPERINCVASVIEDMLVQTHPADKIVLWLAQDQFPGGTSKLPQQLQQYAENGQLDIEWCDDLKPHKKYFYSFQKYPDSIIVTVDDDVKYSKDLLEKLFESYMMFPEAVSAARAHLMAVSIEGEILPYSYWIRDTDIGLYEPSMQLCATGVGGILYPPFILSEKVLDKNTILETCLFADDLWLKAIELISDVPVVAAVPYKEIDFLPGSQETGLKYQNLYNNGNDAQFKKIIDKLNADFHKNIISEKLFLPDVGLRFFGDAAFWQNLSSERTDLNKTCRSLNRKLAESNSKRKEFYYRLEKYKQNNPEAKLKTANRQLYGFITARLDIKNEGSAENNMHIYDINGINTCTETPAWFCDEKGAGHVIKAAMDYGYGDVSFKIKCIKSGKLAVKLKGPDVHKSDGIKIPYWIDYTSLKLNDREMLKETVAAWHNHPTVFTKPVEDGEILNISVKFKSHAVGEKENDAKLNAKDAQINDLICRLAQIQEENRIVSNILTQLYEEKFELQHKLTQIDAVKVLIPNDSPPADSFQLKLTKLKGKTVVSWGGYEYFRKNIGKISDDVQIKYICSDIKGFKAEGYKIITADYILKLREPFVIISLYDEKNTAPVREWCTKHKVPFMHLSELIEYK